MLRALVTATLEFFFALNVFKSKYKYKKIISLILFLLGLYQFGEFIVFITNGNYIGIRIAYFSTTLLPPLGILLIEKLSKQNYGYFFFQIIAAFWAFEFLIFDNLIIKYEFTECCLKIYEYNPIISKYWSIYYIGSLIFSVIILIINILLVKKNQKLFIYLLIGYMTFFPTSIFIITLNNKYSNQLASIMCALAFFFAIILYYINTKLNQEGF